MMLRRKTGTTNEHNLQLCVSVRGLLLARMYEYMIYACMFAAVGRNACTSHKWVTVCMSIHACWCQCNNNETDHKCERVLSCMAVRRMYACRFAMWRCVYTAEKCMTQVYACMCACMRVYVCLLVRL